MIVILGRSGSGKTTAANLFIERYPWYEKAVTITTRPKRDGEVNGKDYLFVDEDYFALLCKNNFFMETNEYRGWLYGTPKSAYRGNKNLNNYSGRFKTVKTKRVCADVDSY